MEALETPRSSTVAQVELFFRKFRLLLLFEPCLM